MEGTAGNLSLRQGETLFITASGRPKGTLSPEEILSLPLRHDDGLTFSSTLRPSAELSIHLALYRLFPETQAVLHVHTVEAALASAGNRDALPLPPLEVLKGLGVADPGQCPLLPVFDNDPLVPEIARKIEERLQDPIYSLPGLLIRHHGTTVWGKSLDEAVRHLELLEFCFRYIVEKNRGSEADRP
jgi:methylthioribulose-1-phosphate dehydratase